MTYRTGHIPDPPAVVQRRKGFHLLKAKRGLGVAPLPLKTNNRQWLLPELGGPGIHDQGPTSRCEGFAHAGAISMRFAVQRTPIAYPSPTGIYDVARMISRVPNADGTLPKLTDDGTEPGLVITGLSEWGACSAKDWGDDPDDPSKVNDEPTSEDMQMTGEFKLDGAYFLTSSGDQYLRDLMTALAEGYPVSGAIAASGNAFQGYSGGVLGPLDDAVDHATAFVDIASWDGVNLSSLVVWACNSWGEAWGSSDVPGISGGLYQCNADFLRKYNSASCALSLSKITSSA